MKEFLSDDFCLNSETARTLYFSYAAEMPIYDYHCHIPPEQIATNHRFENLTDIWLRGDHYKWRAMRANGVSEDLITGDASDREKFQAWAETVPYTIGNPLYQWTHLELRRYYGITDILDGDTAQSVWDRANEIIRSPEGSTQAILREMNVKLVCTTDDPSDSLEHHAAVAAEGTCPATVLPAFRPDKAYGTDDPATWNTYRKKLEGASGVPITSFQSLREALEARIDFFHSRGARISDHALLTPVARTADRAELDRIVAKLINGTAIDADEKAAFTTELLLALGRAYHKRGWVMQFHLGALRNVNSRMYRALGPDTGFDSMDDKPGAASLARFLDLLDSTDQLPKTILYNVNPTDNEVLASMIGNFQDGSAPGKMQFGSGWWFNDQKDGMIRQMTALATSGLLSRFVGMLTDSRSFLSYPRHEYFRRLLCDMIGGWVEDGEVPRDIELLGRMVRDICWGNAVRYFGIELKQGENR